MFQIYQVSSRRFASHSYKNDVIIGAHVFSSKQGVRKEEERGGWRGGEGKV